MESEPSSTAPGAPLDTGIPGVAAVDGPTLERFADLVVCFAANVQKGQIVAIGTEPGKLEVTRAVAAAAYRAGAKYVDVTQFDLHVKRARLLYADEDTLDYVPPWLGERILALGEHRAARIGLTGPSAPGLLSDVDPARAGRDQLPFLRESSEVVNARTTNWTAVPCPTRPWAALVYPSLDADAALEKLWEQVLYMCRLDEADPVAAWKARQDVLMGVSERLTSMAFDALHFEGPGTDLRVGLLKSLPPYHRAEVFVRSAPDRVPPRGLVSLMACSGTSRPLARSRAARSRRV